MNRIYISREKKAHTQDVFDQTEKKTKQQQKNWLKLLKLNAYK